jgi:hypothetical protein
VICDICWVYCDCFTEELGWTPRSDGLDEDCEDETTEGKEGTE